MKPYISIVLILAIFLGKEILAQTIFVGADLSVNGNGLLYVSGNFAANATADYVNNATVEIKGSISNDKPAMTQGSGVTQLTGSSTQLISGMQPFIANSLIINNNSSGGSNIVLLENLIVGSDATFIDGNIEAYADRITFNSNTTWSGASDISHVYGLVEKIGNQAFTFPVGDAFKMRTAAITAPSDVNDKFMCEYIYLDPNSEYAGASLESPIDHISNCEYWMINETEGVSNVTVTLSYDGDYSCGITDYSDLLVAYMLYDTWTWTGLGGIVSGTSSEGTVQAVDVSDKWGAFTLSSSSSEDLPVELLSFIAAYNTSEKRVDLSWSTASEKNSAYFTIERSENGNDWVEISVLYAAGNSAFTSNYYAPDYKPLMGANYYRLKETDFDGGYFYSQMELLTINFSTSKIYISPNPAITSTTINYWAERDEEFQIEIINSAGQAIIKRTIFLTSGNNQIQLEIAKLVPGNYSLIMHSMDFSEIQTEKLIMLDKS